MFTNVAGILCLEREADFFGLSPQSKSGQRAVADPKILKKEGGGRQFISPVLIYHKYTTIYMPFTRKKPAFWRKKILSQ